MCGNGNESHRYKSIRRQIYLKLREEFEIEEEMTSKKRRINEYNKLNSWI